MIKKLRICNFRSLDDTRDLTLGRLNVIVGPNNSGKSSLLYSMLLLKQTLADKDPNAVLVTAGPYVDLGSYLDIVKADSGSDEMCISFELDPTTLKKIEVLDLTRAKLRSALPYNHYELAFSYHRERNAIVMNSFVVSNTTTGDSFSGRRIEGKWQLQGLSEDVSPHLRPTFDHFVPGLEPCGKGPKNRETVNKAIDLVFSTKMRNSGLTEALERVLYVGPIREIIPRYGFMGTQSYSELSPSGQNLMRVLTSRRLRGRKKETLLDQLNYWLDTKFHVLKNVRLLDIDKAHTIKALVADDPKGDSDINLAAMGTGLSQLVPVIVQTVLTPPDGCILIEQPEIHLHPKAQASLGDLFIHHAKDKRQIIVETHSEHLLLRIRRRVAEGRIDPALVKVFFVDKAKRHTRIRQLSMDKSGHFKRWPAGFFEEGYQEAMALTMAQAGGAQT